MIFKKKKLFRYMLFLFDINKLGGPGLLGSGSTNKLGRSLSS